MSRLKVEIESLVFDGVGMDSAAARRLARRTETALERLLRDRGISSPEQSVAMRAVRAPDVKPPAGASEGRWAEELALALYRAVDRWI